MWSTTHCYQDGTPYDDGFYSAATGIDDNSYIFGGYTLGSWMETNEGEGYVDNFVGLFMDADGNPLWTYQVFSAESVGCHLLV